MPFACSSSAMPRVVVIPERLMSQTHQALAALHPMGRMGEVSDIVDAVLYLDGAQFVTGEILHVDGGQAAGHHIVQVLSASAFRAWSIATTVWLVRSRECASLHFEVGADGQEPVPAAPYSALMIGRDETRLPDFPRLPKAGLVPIRQGTVQDTPRSPCSFLVRGRKVGTSSSGQRTPLALSRLAFWHVSLGWFRLCGFRCRLAFGQEGVEDDFCSRLQVLVHQRDRAFAVPSQSGLGNLAMLSAEVPVHLG
jgi:hypothetical protein